jgi:hypothetical protein
MKLRPEIIVFAFLCLALDITSQVLFEGGEISLKRTMGMTYEAKVYLLIDWPASVNKPFITINWGDGSSLDSLPFNGSNCTLEGTSALIYKGSHTFPGSVNYVVSVLDSFLISNIINIPNSSLQKLYLAQEINTQVFNSPPQAIFAGCLSGGIGCNSTEFSFSAAMHDSEGDSLSYSIAGHPGIPGYSLSAVTVNTAGLVTFTSNVTAGFYNVSLKIDEWRKLTGPYSKISSTYREIIFKVDNCTGVVKEQAISAIKMKIFPNPVTEFLHIEAINKEKIKLTIFNALGQVVYYQKDIKENQIDLAFLANGVYNLILWTTEGRSAYRFIKD